MSWSSTLPPAPNQARPLWANDGQAADEDGDDHRQQQADDGADQRAEHPLDALVRPLRAVLGGYSSLQLLLLGFLLKAGTPPALLITSPASGLRRAQSMNLVSAGGLVLPSPGRTMNR